MAKEKESEQTYQAMKAELDSIMEQLQNEELDVDNALVLYRRGLELVQQLEKYLKTSENTIRELKARFDKGSK